MIKAEQIPDEVVKAAVEAWKKDTETFHPDAGTIAAAINAWPGVFQTTTQINRDATEVLILPLTENINDQG